MLGAGITKKIKIDIISYFMDLKVWWRRDPLNNYPNNELISFAIGIVMRAGCCKVMHQEDLTYI